MELRITDTVSPREREELFAALLKYNLPRLSGGLPRDLGIFWEDDRGRRQAGLIGSSHGNWLTVSYLWVHADCRGRGVGSALLRRAEEIGRERGCRSVFLDTFDFQAPEFYRRLGYREVFALTDYPLTGKRFYFTKML
jgi:ribosomal protein S18 acetylase RimI-like enzyme